MALTEEEKRILAEAGKRINPQAQEAFANSPVTRFTNAFDVPAPESLPTRTPIFQPTESGRRFVGGVNSIMEAGGSLVSGAGNVAADIISQSTGGALNLQSGSDFGRRGIIAPQEIPQLGQTATGTIGTPTQATISAPSQSALTAPSQVTPAAPTQEPQSGGTITRDSTGEVFSRATPDSPLTGSLGSIAPRNTPEGFNIVSTPALGEVAQANVDAGRPQNVSAANVEVAQRERLQQEAGQQQVIANQRIEDSLRQFKRDNPTASPEDMNNQRAVLASQEAQARTSERISIGDQVAISGEGRALRKEAAETREAQTAESQSLSRATSAAKGLVQQSGNIGDIAKTAQRQAGQAFTTGVGGLIMSLKPGSTAKDMRANLDTLTADAAFTSLQQMRDASKTGGALGQVSERELTLLGAAVRSLDANQSDEQLTSNIREYVRLRNQSMQRIREAFSQDYGRVAADEVFGGQEQSGKRHENDQDFGGSIEDILLPKSK